MEEFDLLVLSVGIRPAEQANELADKLHLPLDEYGFFGLNGKLTMADMQREGFYAVGACESPRDIAGCIAQAQAVSAAIISED